MCEPVTDYIQCDGCLTYHHAEVMTLEDGWNYCPLCLKEDMEQNILYKIEEPCTQTPN